MDIDRLDDDVTSTEEVDLEAEVEDIDQDEMEEATILSTTVPQSALAMFTNSFSHPSSNSITTSGVDGETETELEEIDKEDGDLHSSLKIEKEKGKLPWVEKYRPARLDDLIDHKEKIDTIRNFIKNNEFPHLLLYGPPGTGKTSLIQAAAREMYGNDYRMYILELNASDHRGIDTIRIKIPNFVRTKSDKIRLVILDEADAMTSEAQGALRRTMEKYIKICRFCIICNKVNKIIPGLQSRTSQMRFGMLDAKTIEPRIKEIATKEGVWIDDEAIRVLIGLQKDFRQIINTLQCLHYVRLGEAPTRINSKIWRRGIWILRIIRVRIWWFWRFWINIEYWF